MQTKTTNVSRSVNKVKGWPSRFALQLWLPVTLVLVWWFASASSNSTFFPPLERILQETWKFWVIDGGFVSHLVPSLLNLGAGYLIALALGVSLGLVIGLNPRLRLTVEPELDFMRAIPAVAILPVALIAIGFGDDMRIAVIAFGAIWPILLNTVDATRSLDPVLRDVSLAYALPLRVRLFLVRLPFAAPQILAGARTALSITVIMIVVSEMSGAYRGVGFVLLSAQRNFAITQMWSAMIVLGFLGYLLNVVFRMVEARLLGWHPSRRVSTHVAKDSK